MSRVELFSFNGYRDWNEGVAHFGPVTRLLKSHTVEMARVAQGIHAGHKDQGHSYIYSEFGEVDGYVGLSDERGLKAAMSIEFGRGPDEDGNGATNGIFALHKATGARIKNQRPRSKRRKDLRD